MRFFHVMFHCPVRLEFPFTLGAIQTLLQVNKVNMFSQMKRVSKDFWTQSAGILDIVMHNSDMISKTGFGCALFATMHTLELGSSLI